jgi:hypothetical protein
MYSKVVLSDFILTVSKVRKTYMASASLPMHICKLLVFYVWLVGTKGAVVYCLVKVLFSLKVRVHL